MNVSTQQLIDLQAETLRTRNICILAHVDHGKTTLSDHLIGSNGLIHPKLLGELRYMDSRDDEQARGITMKSSSIALLYVPGASSLPGGPNSCSADDKRNKGILVNLIDSPGHVDFCSEVSSAARLSDGALVVIDAVEGVCIQTHAVLRQAWDEKVELTLVVNKVDRLILEVQLTPEQAYERLKAIVTQVNMIISAFQSEKYISEADVVLGLQDSAAQANDRDAAEEIDDDEPDYFSPEKGNVAFASAHDGWAFRVHQFAAMHAPKMGIKPNKLASILWGDWAYDAKTKRAVRIKRANAGKHTPLFVQMCLAPLWRAYASLEDGSDIAATLGKMMAKLSLAQVSEKSLAAQEPRKALRAFLQAWLPLSEAVLGMAADQLPNPRQAAAERTARLLPPQYLDSQASLSPPDVQKSLAAIQAAVQSCDPYPEAPTIVHVSKMVAVPSSALPRIPGDPSPTDPLKEVFLAFGRVFAGRLTDGMPMHVLSAAYTPLEPDRHRQEVQVSGVYMMMGRGLERLQHAQAGNIVAIGGLEHAILKSATLASTPLATPIAPMLFQASPIVRVAVEPTNPAQMPQLVNGLRLLNRADPFVEVVVQESGEHVIGAAGEVHLEMCIKDLRERFARIDIHVSPPLVAFRESVNLHSEQPSAIPKPSKVVEGRTANGRCTIRARVHALPPTLASALDENEATLRRVLVARSEQTGEQPLHASGAGEAVPTDEEMWSRREGNESFSQLASRLANAAREADNHTQALLHRAWLLGPHQVGPNLLLASHSTDATSLFDAARSAVVQLGKRVGMPGESGGGKEHDTDKDSMHSMQDRTLDIGLGLPQAAAVLGLSDEAAPPQLRQEGAENGGMEYLRNSVESGVVSGFQLATANGPLCDEPMWGLAFEVEARLHMFDEESSASACGQLAEDVYGPMSGQVTSVARQAFRRAMLDGDPRLVEAMFLCEVSTTAEALSGTYAVLGQRRARILREELREGSNLFTIHAFLPAEASFGFVDDMRRRSSGAASASLMLSHWERLQVDPFFVPTTEEEREEYGEEGQGVGTPNLAVVIIDKVRRRKGLPVDKKVVESATRQRTRAKKV